MGIIPKNTFYNLDNEKQERIINAAVDEFSERNFESASLANIIRAAKIPRGSFYQYFGDKKDLLIYLMNLFGKKKIEYMSDVLSNPDKVPFLVLFKELYISGLQFAFDNPKMVKVAANVFSEKGKLFNEILKGSVEEALKFYVHLIDLDKARGRIKQDVDTHTFAQIVYDMTINITISELDRETKQFNYDKILERITQIIKIFEFGVKNGEYNV